MRNLYVSDLDGTLLRSNERTSEYTNQVINTLVDKGMLFSYATARSYITATKVTEGLHARIPLITYNGAIIVENDTGRILKKNSYLEAQKQEILKALLAGGVCPIVYAYHGEKEVFAYVWEQCSDATKDFLKTRQGDVRETPVDSVENLIQGEVFYFTCIDDAQKLYPCYTLLKEKFHCVYQKDMYDGEQWLEIMPQTATKALAALRLKEMLGCDKIVAFGDGINDLPLFEIADESYAMGNAAEEVKQAATAVIGSNNEDGVARWLLKNWNG